MKLPAFFWDDLFWSRFFPDGPCLVAATPRVTKVIRNDPATVVLFSDGTKRVMKAHRGDRYDGDLGIVLACLRTCLRNHRFDVYERAMRRLLRAARRVGDVPSQLRAVGLALIVAADAMERE